jgi:hypothetical protein
MKDKDNAAQDIEAQMTAQKAGFAWQAVAACVAYSFCSVSMVLANKVRRNPRRNPRRSAIR